ncbi:MAG TPA: cytochrome c [Methylomirabilota bacterium]|jgi:mono/diheme cytochrome c family protein|nr:cytochrome c [Methylomirabilota bacterium]
MIFPARLSPASLLALLAVVALVTAGCSDAAPKNALAERGRQVYLAQCIQCHSPDPAQAGPVGPPVKGASRELLEAKILRADYPPGYRPKRPTKVMPAQPTVAPDIAALAEYLK